jgi:hypothetical protein
MAELPAETVLLSHNGAIAGSVNRFMHRALEATQEYHHELNTRLDQGEDEAMMCAQQADWVYSFAPIASPGAINFLCRSLCKQSRKIGEQDVFQSLWQNWPEISEAVLQPTGTNGSAV